MKKVLCLIVILCLLPALGGCGAEPAQRGSGPLQIVTTVFPACDFAHVVAGEAATVTLLVPPGAELHSFEPTAQDLLRIRDCDLFICTGGESEAWVEELLESQEGEIPTLVMLDCVDALEEEEKEGMQESHEEEHGDGPEYDEHVWTSPVNAQRICRAIAARLGEIDPSGADAFTERCERCCAELGELDAAIRATVAGAAHRTVVFADRFPLRYFVEEYGLEYFAAFPGCAEDTEPAAGTVAFLIDRVREEELPAVFYIEFSNEKMADVICEDTGCRKLLFHSCHNLTPAEFRSGASYLELMRGNAERLREALG
jgi:zinc transport system substrate-binding protein